MTDFNADSIDNSSDIANEAVESAIVKAAPTKAERIAAIDAKITKLQEQRYNIENDIVAAPKAAKVVVLPAVGDTIVFTYGRRTPTTEPVQRVGVVIAVKPKTEVEGKSLPAQVKVQAGEGFDAELITIYPAQIVSPFDVASEESAE